MNNMLHFAAHSEPVEGFSFNTFSFFSGTLFNDGERQALLTYPQRDCPYYVVELAGIVSFFKTFEAAADFVCEAILEV